MVLPPSLLCFQGGTGETDTKLAFLNTPTFPVFSPPTFFNPAFILRFYLSFIFYLAFIYCTVFKILNGYENIDSNIFFEIKESKITRGHNYTLVRKQSRLDVRKYSFSQRTINVWNKLSTDCVHASSVNMFKNKIDKYLAKAGYT